MLLLALLPPLGQVRAEGEFQADYDVEYAVNSEGIAVVTQHIVLTNKVTNIYPKQYSILLDTEKIGNVIVFDKTGPLKPEVTNREGKTTITVQFREQVVGINKTLPFTLRYENYEIATHIGSIWEINIPGVTNSPGLDAYEVSLTVPKEFGPNAYMVPSPASGHKWNKEQMINGGVSAAYGEEQFFSLRLTYYINPEDSVNRATSEIALPPDTSFQKVSIRSIEPKPDKIIRDRDGNWLAQYPASNKSIKIVAEVTVSISLKPRTDFGKTPISQADYLIPTRYWNNNHPLITGLSKNYGTAQSIYEFVTKTLTYDYDKVENNPVRLGAVEALTNPGSAVCTEFTDTFVALARAAGIPARQAVGYAYTTNARLRPLSLVSDVLHVWPEYYDLARQVWIPVDPTWGNTTGGVNYFDKLDFNHIVFALNGISDEYPFPAGSYRSAQSGGKIVEVEFARQSQAQHISETPEILFDFPDNVFSGLRTRGQVRVKNSGGVAINDIGLTVISDPAGLRLVKELDLIPPYTTTEIPFDFTTPELFSSGQGSITVHLSDSVSVKRFHIRSFWYIIIAALTAGTIISFCIGLLWKRLKQRKTG